MSMERDNDGFVGSKIKFEDSNFSGSVIETETKAKPFRPKRIKREKIKIDPDALKRHSRGPAAGEGGVKTNLFKQKLKQKEIYLKFSNEQAARTEILRNEEEGFIEADEGESTVEYTQSQIVQNVDIASAAKHFSLNLEFGPYRMKYTKNGRHLLIGGRKGHVAAFDWITKRLHCELNVTEEVADVAWLHIETMFAVAQKSWVHFYDNQGTELHCVKNMNRVNRLEFLPYHFLLASGNEAGFLSWLDTSIGEMVADYNTRLGPVRIMTQNPTNGVLCLGGSKGVVSMWSPSTREPLAKLLCHATSISSIAVDPKGTYMATCGLDKSVRIWDIRAPSIPLTDYKIRLPAQHMAISQRGLLALAMGNVCEVHKKPNLVSTSHAYIMQRCDDFIHGMQFCPFEDVLGITTRKGFQSLLVPGSGEANFDALEANPYQTKSQRRENEVKSLLDKIPFEFIALDPAAIGRVDVPSFREKIEAKKKLLYLKPPTINFKRANKMKGKGGSANTAKVKQIVKNAKKKEFVNDIKGIKQQIFKEAKSNTSELSADQPKHVLDRFKTKKKTKFTIKPNKLNINGSYNFTLTVTSSKTNSHSIPASQSIKVVTEFSNQLRIKCIRNCRNQTINPQDTLHLKAICLTCTKSENFVWQIFPTVDQQQSLQTSRLVVEADTLVPGENYQFNVSLRDGRGYATIELSTAKKISGNCFIYPTEGLEASTNFTVNCNQGAQDLQRLHTLYQGKIQLLSSNKPVFSSKLYANDEGLAVRIQDSNGQYLRVELEVKIAESIGLNSIDEINEIFTSKNDSLDLKRIIADETQSSAIAFINMVAGRLNKLASNGSIDDTIMQMLDLLNGLRVDHFDDIASIAETMRKLLLPVQMSHKIALKCATILDKISLALGNYDEDVSASDYVNTTNRVLSGINQLIDPFENIPPVQNLNPLISSEYHTEDYEDYGELDFGIFEKLENLENVTASIEQVMNALATCAAKSFQPMERLMNMSSNAIQVEVLPFDQELASQMGNRLTINGSSVAVTVSEELLSQFDGDASISCTFFDKNPLWWFPDGIPINSDVVSVSIYKSGLGESGETVEEITTLQSPLQIALEIKNTTATQAQRNEVLKSSSSMSSFKIKCPKNGILFVNFTRLDADASIKVYFTNRSLRSSEILKENHTATIDGMNQGLNSFNYKCSMAVDDESLVFMSILSNGLSNSSAGGVSLSFGLSTAQCLHWETVSNSWQSSGCSVDGDLSSTNRIHCKCSHLSLFAVKYHKSDFCAVFPDNAKVVPMKSVIWLCVLFLVIIFAILAMWAWRREKLDENNQKLVYLNCDHITSDRPYLYGITVVTGSRPDANTTSHVGIELHGSDYTSPLIPLYDRDAQLFQRGNINNFIIQTRKSVGRISKISLCLDCHGPHPSWYCDAIVVRDLQRNEEWNFDVMRWFVIDDKSFTASIGVISEREYYDRKRLFRLHWTELLHSSYSLFSICLRRSSGQVSRVENVFVTFVSVVIGFMANTLFFGYNQVENLLIQNILLSAAKGLCTTYMLRVFLIYLLVKSNKIKKNRKWKVMFARSVYEI